VHSREFTISQTSPQSHAEVSISHAQCIKYDASASCRPLKPCCGTGQHLLSAVVEGLTGADTVSWELHPQQLDSATADTLTIDLSVPTLTPRQLSDIEAQCNAHIRAAHNIKQLVLDGSPEGQAERQMVIEKGNLRGKLPPADVIEVVLLTSGHATTLTVELKHYDGNPNIAVHRLQHAYSSCCTAHKSSDVSWFWHTKLGFDTSIGYQAENS